MRPPPVQTLRPLCRMSPCSPKPSSESQKSTQKIDLLIDPRDLLRPRAAVPQVKKIEHQADVVARRFVEQLQLLLEPVERRERQRFEIEAHVVCFADSRQLAQILRRQPAQLGPGHLAEAFVRAGRVERSRQQLHPSGSRSTGPSHTALRIRPAATRGPSAPAARCPGRTTARPAARPRAVPAASPA